MLMSLGYRRSDCERYLGLVSNDVDMAQVLMMQSDVFPGADEAANAAREAEAEAEAAREAAAAKATTAAATTAAAPAAERYAAQCSDVLAMLPHVGRERALQALADCGGDVGNAINSLLN